MEKACSTILMIMLLVVTLQGFSISDGQTSSNDKVLVSITKNSIVYLSSQDLMVRAHIEITDYSPADGELFMKIVKKSSGEIVSESKIYVRPNSEDIWSTEIGYVVDNQDPNDLDSLVGSYEIQISPENGAYQGSATFQVLLKPIPGPKIQSITAADPTDSASYSNGDTITVVFSEPTNQPMVATKADLDRLFSFSQNLGADYTGIWVDSSTLVISIVDSEGATPPTTGSFRITLKDGGDLTNAEGTSLVSKVTSPVLIGTFGTVKETSTIDKQEIKKDESQQQIDAQKSQELKLKLKEACVKEGPDSCSCAPPDKVYACGVAKMAYELNYLHSIGYDSMIENMEYGNEIRREANQQQAYQQQVNMITWSLILIPIICATIAIIIVIKRKVRRKKSKTIKSVLDIDSKHASEVIKEQYGNNENSQEEFNKIRKNTDEDEWKGA